MLLPSSAEARAGMATKGGQRTISSRLCSQTMGRNAETNSRACSGVLYIFQLPAISFFLMTRLQPGFEDAETVAAVRRRPRHKRYAWLRRTGQTWPGSLKPADAKAGQERPGRSWPPAAQGIGRRRSRWR